MAWPTSQDYNEAIQSPARHFADPDLCRGRAVAGPLGIPMPCSGNFADVYQVQGPDGSHWAVKCFTRGAARLGAHYEEISRHLRRASLPFIIEFTYLEKGILVAGRWYPVLKMKWVEGVMLNQFVAQYANSPTTLEALLKVWRRLARHLQEAEAAHGDLQHGNVLLVPAREGNGLALRLVDYDGMWVPSLAGVPSGEVGHPSYQHPQRLREQTYGPELDRFPLLLVATALRALKSRGRELWKRFDTGDNLLFRTEDLAAPSKSPLFHELLTLSDPVDRLLVGNLIEAARKPLDQTPLLAELMPQKRPASSRPPSPVAVAVSPPAARPVTPVAQVKRVGNSGPSAPATRAPGVSPGQTKANGGGSSVGGWIAAGVVLLVLFLLCAVAGFISVLLRS